MGCQDVSTLDTSTLDTTQFDLQSIDIEAIDHVNVPAGTYTVDYTIEELTSLIESYGAVVSIRVNDHANETVAISGNQFTVEENETYTVTIRLTVDDDYIEKTITIQAIVIEEAPVTISFEMDGGTPAFGSITQAKGLPVTLTDIPTKDGYLFTGWFYDVERTNPYQNEVINEDTTLYARFDLATNVFHVTFDLNGAFQSVLWQVEVPQGEAILEMPMDPVWDGYIFTGWALDPNGEMMFDADYTFIYEDLTVYAIWAIDYQIIEDEDLFESILIAEDSVLNEGYVEQRFSFETFFQLQEALNDYSITGVVHSFGYLLSPSETVSLDDERAIVYYGESNAYTSHSQSYLPIRNTTLPLMSEATYFYRFFVVFDQTIVYTPIEELQTYSIVPTGFAVGCSNVVSGGYYQIDNGTDTYRPAMYIEILDGYEATVDGIGYGSYQALYREGYRTLITTDLSTGKGYLHVFHVDFQYPDLTLTLKSIETNSSTFKPTFSIIFPHAEEIDYPTPYVGIFYSTESPFLKIGLDDATVATGTYDHDEMTFTTNSSISGGADGIYIRGFAVINEKISYSSSVYYLEKGLDNNFTVVEEIHISENHLSPDQLYSWSFGPTATAEVYNWDGDSWELSTFSNSVEIDAEGQYFVRLEGQNTYEDVLIIDDLPNPEGIEDGVIYTTSVFATLDAFDSSWYYSYNGGDYVYLPQQIRFSLPGIYDVFYRDATGYTQMTFIIQG